MTYRQTAAERLDETLKRALVALRCAEMALVKTYLLKEALRAAEAELTRHKVDERHAAAALSSLRGVGWSRLFNEVLGTAEDVRVIEQGALARALHGRLRAEKRCQTLRGELAEAAEIAAALPQRRRDLDEALSAKESWSLAHGTSEANELRSLKTAREQAHHTLCNMREAYQRRQERGAHPGELRLLETFIKDLERQIDRNHTERRSLLLSGLEPDDSLLTWVPPGTPFEAAAG